MKPLIFLFFIFSILTIGFVSAHGNILYDVDLSFDTQLEDGVTNSAKDYIQTTEEPVQYDYERELINVKFGDKLDYHISVHPLTFEVHGFRNDNLITRQLSDLTEEDMLKTAQQLFDNLDENYKSQLVYGEGKKQYTGTYIFSWYRQIDNIIVLNDLFSVEIDGGSGEVIAWHLSPFFYPTKQVDTKPAITHQVARQIALTSLDAEPLDDDPILVINNLDLIWQVPVKILYPIVVGINAHTGEIEYTGAPRGDVPKWYEFKDAEIVENEFIRGLK